MKVKFTYPQIYFDSKEVEIPDESTEWDSGSRPEFILSHLTEDEISWIPTRVGRDPEEALASLLDIDMIKIVKVKE